MHEAGIRTPTDTIRTSPRQSIRSFFFAIFPPFNPVFGAAMRSILQNIPSSYLPAIIALAAGDQKSIYSYRT